MTDLHSAQSVLGGGDISFPRVAAALVLCLMLGIAAILVMRRVGVSPWTPARGPSTNLRVLESMRLDARTTLHLIRAGETELLIACDAGGVKTLGHVTIKQEVTS
jgi:flagellar protein FliO/FliZ